MRQKLNIYTSLIWVLIFISTAACNNSNNNDDDDDVQNQHLDAQVDVFVKKRHIAVQNEYALCFSASGQGISSCKVVGPDGYEHQLEPYWEDHHLRYLPKESDFANAMPMNGYYRFLIEFEDKQSKVLEDELLNIEIDAISSATISHSSGYHSTSLAWTRVDSVDEYVIKLTDRFGAKNQPLFCLEGLDIDDSGLYFDSTTHTASEWFYDSFPAYGDTCYIVVEAWRNSKVVEGAANREMFSESSSLITW